MTTANYGFLGKISIHESVIKTLGKHGFAHPMSSDKSTTDLLVTTTRLSLLLCQLVVTLPKFTTPIIKQAAALNLFIWGVKMLSIEK